MVSLSLAKNLNGQRTWLLLRNRLVEDLPFVGIGLGIMAGLNVLSLLFAKRVFFNQVGSLTLWNSCLVLGGLLLSAQSFKTMHSGKAGTDWLLLPATSLEKYLAALLAYCLVYPLVGSALVMGLSALLWSVARLFGADGGHMWTPLLWGELNGLFVYILSALIMVASSAAWRKAAFMKTALVAVVYAVVIAWLALLTLWLVGKCQGAHLSRLFVENGVVLHESMGQKAVFRVSSTLQWLYRVFAVVIFPGLTFLYGYFKVFEKEARDEVQ